MSTVALILYIVYVVGYIALAAIAINHAARFLYVSLRTKFLTILFIAAAFLILVLTTIVFISIDWTFS